ncbi:hypothetical protein HD806DRAFT_547453 [Xylariaceae sp. AK1471]|nr:hypothetical protein HD806DRAFT_547453 [Xylariaceae sp. AK1471]
MDLTFASSDPRINPASRVTNGDRVNLNHLMIQIPGRKRYSTASYALNQFLSSKGRTSAIRMASDFDYDAFRARLFADEGIPVDRPLVPSPIQGEMPSISTRSNFFIVLTQIQGSSLEIEPIDGLPTLQLDWNRLPGETIDESGEETVDQPVDETPQRAVPPAEDEENEADQLIDDSPIASTPMPPKTSLIPEDAEVIDLTVDKSGEEEPVAENPAEESYVEEHSDPIMRQLGFDFAKVDDEIWDEVCALFSCEREVEKIKVQGINVEIQPYQALAIWKALGQVVNTGIPSFMIADDVGFGKTGVALCVTVIFHIIHRSYKEAQSEWKTLSPRNPKHLPKENQQLDDICPTQKGRVQCPCKHDSFTRHIVGRLPDFPTLIVAPPQLIPSWLGESRKWIDTKRRSPASDMKVLIAHSSFEREPEFLNSREAQLIRAKLERIPTDDDDDVRYRLRPQESGGSQNIILISSANAGQFLKNYEVKVRAGRAIGRRTRQRNKDTHAFGAAFVFFDEFHNYCGKNIRKPTVPFEMLRRLREANEEAPVVAIGVSGSCRTDPGNWKPFVNHAFLTAQHLGIKNFEIAGMSSTKDFDTYESDWHYLAQYLQDNTFEGSRLETREKRKEHLLPFLKLFIDRMMISRKKGDKFRGKVIQKPRSKPIWIDCPMKDGPAHDVFEDYTSKVKSWLNVDYEQHIKNLTQQGVAEKPTRKAYLNTRMTAISQNVPSAKAERCRDYQVILRSSAFPAVAQLVKNESIRKIKYESILVKEIGPIAQRISQQLTPRSFRNGAANQRVLNELSGSDWMPHSGMLLEQSPKLAEVQKQIDELLDIAELPLDHPSLMDKGPPPADGTNLRHMLILADNPLSAFLTMMVLFPRYYTKKVHFLYAHSQVTPRERYSYCDYIQKDCVRGDPLKVLISTIETMAEGLNLWRAHSVILTEVPKSSADQAQAFGRVDRTGQVMTPSLIQLYDSRNLAEEVRQRRNQNRDRLAEVGPEDFGLAEMVMNEGEQ